MYNPKNSKFKLNKGFIVQKLDGKITIFDGDESLLYTFNETASYIFSKIKSGWDKEKIIAQVVKRYVIKPDRVQTDFVSLVNDLLTKRIITQTKE